MNKLKLFFGLFLGAATCLGVGAKMFFKEDAIKTNAVSSIFIKGDFNGWGEDNPLSDPDSDGIWTATGSFTAQAFKIVIDGTWYASEIVDTSDTATTQYVGYNPDNTQANLWFTEAATFIVCVDTNNSNKLTVSKGVQNVSLAGSLNDWTARADGYTFAESSGIYSLNDVEINAGESFKIVVNNGVDVWCGGYCLNGSDAFTSKYFNIPSGSDPDGNIAVSFSGIYSFSFVPNAKSNWGTLTISGELDTVSVTLKVTFTSSLDSWIDLYLPGGFNSWSSSAIMTPSDARNAFTYEVDLVPGEYEYQLVACYHSTGFQWTTYIDSKNQSYDLSGVSDNDTITIRSDLVAPNMPQEYVADGAVVALTMSARVDRSINLYFVGTLTNWGNVGYLSSALMTPNAGRTVFTWEIPEETPTGNTSFKIVAMYANGDATAASYDYTIYSDNGGNATLTLDTSTLSYNLNSSYDLTELGAIAFSRDFNSAMATPCSNPSADNKSAVSAIWGTWKGYFEGLTDGAKTYFGSLDESNVVQARTLYVHCVSRYSLTAWTGAPEASNRINISIIEINKNGAAPIIVSVIAVLSLTAIGGYYFLKKGKKEKENTK